MVYVVDDCYLLACLYNYHNVVLLIPARLCQHSNSQQVLYVVSTYIIYINKVIDFLSVLLFIGQTF